MGTRAVLQVFEKYQKERVAFVTAIAELSKSPQVGKTAHAVLHFPQVSTRSDGCCASECRGVAASRGNVFAATFVAR